MRLIDADDFRADIMNLWDYNSVNGITAETVLKQVLHDLDNAPTVPLPDFKEGYKQAIRDGKTNFSRPQGEWVPVSERLPNSNGCYIVTRIIEDTTISDVCYFDGQNTWHNDNRVNHGRPYLNDITAWQPLPEPYELQKGGAEND